MASPENATNEKTADFEDVDYDPDLEARLYAEIYYSNETYVPDTESSTSNIEKTSNATTTTKNVEANLATPNIENNLPTNNFVEDCRPDENIITGHKQLDIGKSYYPTPNWESAERTGDKRPSAKPTPVRRQRLLAHKGLWLTPENTNKNRVFDRNDATPKQNDSIAIDVNFKSPKSVPKARLTANQEDKEKNIESAPIRQSKRLQCLQANRDRETIEKHRILKQERAKRRKERREKQRSRKKRLTLERQEKDSNDACVIVETSKYKVVSKKNKLKMREINAEPVDISSDSDDSILEVPVPPKAPPVIIQLPDSDDDCEESEDTSSKKKNVSVVERRDESAVCENIEAEESTSNLVATAGRSNLLSNNDNPNEASKNGEKTGEVFVEPPCPEENTLILNCTEIQRGASSLDEIRRIRETVPSIHTHSDDSMTESEANNWGNLAAGQSDIGRAEEICSNEISNDTVNTELWNQLRQETPSAAGLPEETLSSFTKASPVGRTAINVEKNSNESMTNESATSSRKRQKDVAASSFTDFGVPAIPEKRSKRSKDKSAREESLTEYFFKPMSKELQAFYNNPWGGENMDVYDVQSRMPRNPRCWTILDADLQGPTSKRRRACPRCKTDTHYGKRCPEKPKAPCCYMCGDRGHNESRCPRTMCLTCGRRYATYRPTCGFCSKLYCNRCNGSGHTNTNCPDLWRRYHNTTTETIPITPRDNMNIMKSPQYLTCCNCAKRGHDVSMCRQLRWSQHFPTPMYVSNYADGPFYPSFQPESIPNTFPYEDLTDRPVQHEPIIDSNPNDSSTYLAPTERIREACPQEDIETFESHYGFNAPHNEPANSIQPTIPTGNVIFQYENLGSLQSADLHNITMRLDVWPNVHLDGLLAGRLIPNFVNNWQHLFAFSVRIIQSSDEALHMVIEGIDKPMLNGLKKLMLQWLTRKDDEKPNLEYDNLPYNVDQITKIIKPKIVLLNNVLDPVSLFKKVIACEDDLKNLAAKVNRSLNESSKKKARRMRCFQKQVLLVTTRRAQLVTSLYAQSWVEGGDGIVGFFRALARKTINSNKLPLRKYFHLIYANNEIFTFHTNKALSDAMDRAILAAREADPASVLVPEASTVATPESRVENVGENNISGEKSAAGPSNLPIESRYLQNNSSPLSLNQIQQITVIEDRGTETLEIPAIFGTTGPQDAVTTNSNDGADIINFQENSKTPLSIRPERPNLRNKLMRAEFMKAKHAKTKNASTLPRRGVKNDDAGLLRNLTKRNRKLYKCAAKEVIKLANRTNKPNLQKMAKELKLKIGNGSITTNDVHMLQQAVGVPLKQNLVNQPSQNRNSLRKNYDNSYEAFLRDL